MKALTKAELVAAAAERWRDNYYRDGRWKEIMIGETKPIYEQLRALKEPTAEAVNAIIGNESWTRLHCDHCHREVERVVIMDVTRGEYTTYICDDCLRQALNLVS